MTHVLYIEASPRKKLSASIEVAHAALAAMRDISPDLTVDKLDVWTSALPEFNGVAMEAKYAGISGIPLTEEQTKAWASIRELTKRFHAADCLVIAAPLWNFSIPYRFKQLIDVVSQKDLLFSFDERGLTGLLTGNKKALLICARGLDYGPGSATPAASFDFQRPYLEAWLRFIGISDVTTIIVEKTLFEAEISSGARAAASRQACVAVEDLVGKSV